MRVQIPQLTFQLRFKTLIFTLLISIILLSGAGLLARSLQSEPPISIVEGQQTANAIVSAIGQNQRVSQIAGGYFPDEGLFLYSTMQAGEQTTLPTWIGTQLLPFSEQFKNLPENEIFIWVIDVDGTQLVLRAPLSRANESATHRFVTHANNLFSADSNPFPAISELDSEPALEPTEETAVSETTDLPDTIDEELVTEIIGETIDPDGSDLAEGVTFDFENQTGRWLILDGDWQLIDGIYRQQSQDGFDFISMLSEPAPQTYTLETSFRQLEGQMGGGLIFNAPFADRRGGAQIIDIDNEGRFLRWGHYLNNDNFVFDGGTALSETVADGEWHILRVVLTETTATFFLDSQPVGQTSRLENGSFVGLVTSLTTVEFDNFSIFAADGDAIPEASDASETADLSAEATLPEDLAEPVEQPIQPNPAPVFAGNGAGQAIRSQFENGAAGWQPLSGNWIVNNGSYVQDDSSGFDFISMLNTTPLSTYTLEAQIKSLNGQLGGGFIYHAPNLDQRQGAHLVDLTDAGSVLRWGYYDETGEFIFAGSTAVNPPIADGEFHQLRLITSGTQTEIFLDDQFITQIENQNEQGYVGLITSQAQVEFDDVNVIEAPDNADLFSTEDYADEFSDTLDDWASLSGSWEIIDNELQQTTLGEADQVLFSPFYGRNYTMQARFRLVEGEMGGGFLFNAASQEQLNGSQMLAFTQQGNALQWGHFDEDGSFVFQGITDVRQNAPTEWHTLKVAVVDGIATFVFDNDLLIENIELAYEQGYAGLFNSFGQLAIDDFTITLDTDTVLTQQELEIIERIYTFETDDNSDWVPLAGNWQIIDGVYEQQQQDEFDRLTRLNQRLIGDYRIATSLRYIEGEMGAGLIFNMQQPDNKAGSQMVSFTANGEFLQWGHFDEAGVFTFEGGAPVASVEDGEWHQLAVITRGNSFSIELNGEVLASELPLTYQNGFVGLFDGLSWVAFDDVEITGFTLPDISNEAFENEANDATDLAENPSDEDPVAEPAQEANEDGEETAVSESDDNTEETD